MNFQNILINDIDGCHATSSPTSTTKVSGPILGARVFLHTHTCVKVDNQSLKAVIERKGSTKIVALNSIGKQIYWLQQLGEFALRLEYVKSM